MIFNSKTNSFLLIILFLILYIVSLGVFPLIRPDETRYAEIPREMIAAGDWIVPHLNGLRYFEKPVLGYWLNAGSIMLFGENEFAVRFTSAVSVGITALLIYMLLYHSFEGSRKKRHGVSALAALIFMTCLEVFGVGTTAVLDSMFAAFVSLTIAAFYFATESVQRSRRENLFLFLAGVFCGLAFLTKGFLAFAIPVLVFVPYLMWQRRYRDLLRLSWKPGIIAMAVVAPWAIMIHLREPDFWKFFFWNEHIRRFTASTAQHKESFWFFFLAAPGMFMPWTLLIPVAFTGIKNRLHKTGMMENIVKLSICWLIFPFLFLSLSRGKLLTYILPCFPPFAILMSAGLFSIKLKHGRSLMLQRAICLYGVLLILLLLAFVYTQIYGCDGFIPYTHIWKTAVLIGAFVVSILFSFLSFKSRIPVRKIILFGLSPAVLLGTVHFVFPDRSAGDLVPNYIFENSRIPVTKETVIIADESIIRTACWNLKRNDIYLLDDNLRELTYGLSYPDSAGRVMDAEAVRRTINSNKGNVLLIIRSKYCDKWKSVLPAPARVYAYTSGKYEVWLY